ncbi:MAG: T9SS type A sorting domain-containing protein [Ignavibacteria bacterium]|jgi:hypothetical protein|nr:T9SS type A sorting domain-containing protein [Ignavibacteria bacterium]
MTNKILLILLFFICYENLFPQIFVNQPILKTENTSNFGTDVILLNYEPVGVMHGIQNTAGEIFVAINDTHSTQNLGLVIRKSTDRGKTWSTQNGISYRDVYGNIKLLRNSEDSIYCIFQIGSGVYSWNIQTDIINTFRTHGYFTFDAEITSSNTIYLFVDSLTTDHLMIYSSLDGGTNWGTRRLVSERSANVKVVKSTSSDTMFVNYYGPVLLDTSQSIIRSVRYYETSPGSVFYSGFKDMALEQLPKREFMSVVSKGVVWFLYTLEEDSSEILYGKRSVNNGVNYSERMVIAPAENNNQKWFNIKPKFANEGFHLIYFSESSNFSVNGNIISADVNYNGSTFNGFTQINDIIAAKSNYNYKPIIVPLPFDSTFGYVWVGDTEDGKKVFWDSELILNVDNDREITIADMQLQQNYPNPFNSNTIINYSIPMEGNVNITIYDVLGSSRGQLINKIQKAGEYSFNFNAEKSSLESGVYFYRIVFTDLNNQNTLINTKKLIYLK